MKIDVLARDFGTPAGAPNGMAMAAGYLAETLERIGHQVRRAEWPDFVGADLIITTISPTWHRVVAAAAAARRGDRLVYWHHAGGVPEGHGCMLAAPPVVEPQPNWSRHVVLPPSSWAAEAGGSCVGSEVLVAGCGPPKGGHIALEVARLCPDLRFFVLQGRSSLDDRRPWLAQPNAELATGIVTPQRLLERARVVLSPTRFEVHPLLLVEAAARGIPIVCSDLPSCRAAAGDRALYLPVAADPVAWSLALRVMVGAAVEPLRPHPYAEVVRDALAALIERRAAA